MRTRIFLKLIAGLCGLIAMALLATNYLTSRVVESTYMSHRWREMEDKARLLEASQGDSLADSAKLRQLAQAAGARLTLIARDGTVIADSAADARGMENHSERPEVKEALAGRRGSSIRPSATLQVDYLYLALPAPQGVLRIAVPLSEVQRDEAAIRLRTLQSIALAFVPVVLIALFLARKTSNRLGTLISYAGELANGNFHARVPDFRSGELAVLGRKLNETSAKLERTVQQL
jgi:two-component system phosphate regulon sensor histidine kinase PhoR